MLHEVIGIVRKHVSVAAASGAIGVSDGDPYRPRIASAVSIAARSPCRGITLARC